MNKYDYLIVGSGLFGATFAHFAHRQGKKCLVIDKRSHLGGNIYCENIEVYKIINQRNSHVVKIDLCDLNPSSCDIHYWSLRKDRLMEFPTGKIMNLWCK